MRKKLTPNACYAGSMMLGLGALLCTSGVENSVNGWAMLGWTFAALALGAVALVLAGLGVSAEPENRRKVHKPQKNTVKPPRQNRRGA